MAEDTPRSRVGDFLERLKSGGGTSSDPFSPDYYDVEEEIKRRDNMESQLALNAINLAREKIGLPRLSSLNDVDTKIWHQGQKVAG